MDTLQVAADLPQQTFAIELLKLFIFSIFVTAFLEVFKEIYKRFDPDGMQEQTTKIFNYSLALLFCYAFDYGVMGRLVAVGTNARQGLSGWLDYLGTAALVYMGADWTFNKFSAMIAKAKAAKALANTPAGDSTVIKTKTTQEESSTVIDRKS